MWLRSSQELRQICGAEGYHQGIKAVADGQYDDMPEQAFYMVGTIEELRRRRRNSVGVRHNAGVLNHGE